jgi:microcystin-dependent protein
MTVTGAGSERNPYVVTSNVTDIETGFDVQYNNVDVIRDVHRIDFRGTAVHISPGTDEAVVTVTVPDPTTGAIIPTGCVWMFGMSNMPAGWLLCDGTLQQVTTFPNLFAAIGTNFGGDGVTTFGVPDLTDRFPVGQSVAKPIDGVPGGAAVASIAVANLPPHTHSIAHNHTAKNTSSAGQHDHSVHMSTSDGSAQSLRRGSGSYTDGPGPVLSDGSHVHSVDLGNYVGNTSSTLNAAGSPLNVMPPYQALAFGIKT